MSRKNKTYKVSRGKLEQQRLHEDNVFETQRALLFILPVLMVAVLAVGLYFGYQTYLHNRARMAASADEAAYAAEEQTDPMLLTVVFSANPLEPDYVPALKTVDGVEVSAYAAAPLKEMLQAAKDDGIDLILEEGYISFEEQKEKYETAVKQYRKKTDSSIVKSEAYIKTTIPKEGESEQQTGLLISLSTQGSEQFNKTSAFRWLQRNAADYGFVLRYPDKENVGGLSYSPNFYRYVGKENALSMRVYNMNFDEYVAYLSAQ